MGPRSGDPLPAADHPRRLPPPDDQRGRFRFVLDGNGWRFPAGHRIVVELLGRDAPTYLASPAAFSARLRDLKITLPVRERRPNG